MEKDNIEKLNSFLSNTFDDSDTICVSNIFEQKKGGSDSFLTVGQFKKSLTKRISIAKENNSMLAITPNILPSNCTKRNKENILYLNALFCDIDHSLFSAQEIYNLCSIKPHYIFQRTETNYHLYWLIEREKPTSSTNEQYSKIINYLITELNGDRAVKDISRVLRLPYSYHCKNTDVVSYYKLVYEIPNPRYQLNSLYEIVSDKKKTLHEFDEGDIINFLKNEYASQPKLSTGDGRSLKLYFIGSDCYRWGLTLEQAIELAKWYNEKKFDPPEPEKIIRHQIHSAFKYTKDNQGIYLDSYNNSKSDESAKKVLNKFLLHTSVQTVMRNYCYGRSQDKLIETENGIEAQNSSSFDRHVASLGLGITFKDILQKQLIRIVDDIEFNPKKTKTFYRKNSRTIYNTYRKPNIYLLNDNTMDKEHVDIFIKHLKYLSSTEVELNMLVNFLAYLIQKPGHKIFHALLLISPHQGIGKSILELFLKNIFKHYVTAIQNTQMDIVWNGFLENNLIVFIHELYQGDNYKTASYFKTLITEESVYLNKRWQHEKPIKNTSNFIMCTNHLNSIRTDRNDRRLGIIYCEEKPKPQLYYDRLVNTCSTPEGINSLFSYFYNYDLSAFNPHARPPMTIGKEIMIEQSKSELEIFFEDAIENKEGPFKDNVLTIDDLLMFAQINGLRNKVTPNSINRVLRQLDFVQHRISKQLNGIRKTKKIWAHRDLDISTIEEKKIIQKLGFNQKQKEEEAVYGF